MEAGGALSAYMTGHRRSMMPKFSRDALKKIVRDIYDANITANHAKVEELRKVRPHDEAVAEWRLQCIAAIGAVAKQGSGVSDEDLLSFRLPRYPDNVQAQIDRYEQMSRQEVASRDRILSLLDALVADKDGNLNVSVADLRGIGVR